MKSAGRIIAAALLAATPALAQQAGTLRIGLASDIDTLDPVLSNTIAGRSVLTALCDKLLDVDVNLNFVPRLAERWAWSEDRRALTLTLRQGATFHDGSPVDAEAVRFSLNRAATLPSSRRRSEIAEISAIEVPDARTVVLRLSAPSAPLLAQLADRAGMVMSPTALQAAGNDFARAPICSGPFAFVAQVPQERIDFRRFPGHWNAAEVKVESVSFRPIPDSTVRILNLRSGSLDLVERVAANDVAGLRRDTRLRYAEARGFGFTSIIANVGNGPRAQNPFGQDARLRQAFDLALDRDALNQVVFEGANTPGNQPIPPGSPFYAPSFPMAPRDVAAARRLLAEAGQPAPQVTMLVPNIPEFRQMAEVMQAMVRDAGFDLRIEVRELATAAGMMNRGEFQAFLIGWSGRVDPDGNIFAFNHCRGANNDSKFCDPRVDAALEAARASVEPAERARHYAAALGIALPDRHRIYLVHEGWRFAHAARLSGFRALPDGIMRLEGVTLN
ncbi:ABC transporter substrate-binding protein [Roseomonas stagni]|uniref:ABC transporter substrate-binding protein n=1 Tax=Falsiroseomonas algicola TaxID=2716930 RepID=A0A6M1LMY2_9PROT|nr:ABC transporter substrate-binding protein [Falsiroseomonas algicola]NGM21567.1 ABC transporter substrate-binding protein [Falsiroseomonas algicola]